MRLTKVVESRQNTYNCTSTTKAEKIHLAIPIKPLYLFVETTAFNRTILELKF